MRKPMAPTRSGWVRRANHVVRKASRPGLWRQSALANAGVVAHAGVANARGRGGVVSAGGGAGAGASSQPKYPFARKLAVQFIYGPRFCGVPQSTRRSKVRQQKEQSEDLFVFR